MIGERIIDFYTKVEDKWFGLIEGLGKRGIPADMYVDFFENKGIPSLPVTLALLVILWSLIFVPVPAPDGTMLQLSIVDEFGKPLSGTTLTISVNGKTVDQENLIDSSSEIAVPKGVLGSTITVNAMKDGYSKATGTSQVFAKRTVMRLQLTEHKDCTEGKIRFIDDKTSTPVKNLIVTIKVDELIFSATPEADGTVRFTCIPQGKPVSLTVKGDGYEDYREVVNLQDGLIVNRKLDRSSAALSGETTLQVEVRDITTGELIPNSIVKIFDSQTDEQINIGLEETPDGVYLYKFNAGTLYHVIVEKEDFILLKTDSELAVAGEKKIIAELKQGSEKLSVVIFDGTITLPQGVKIIVTDATGEIIAEEDTDFSGQVTFDSLDPNQDYRVIAYKSGFLTSFAVAEKGRTSGKNEITMTITPEIEGETKTLTLRKENAPAKGVKVQAFMEENGILFPLAIPDLETDDKGQVKISVPRNIKVIFRAESEFDEAQAEFEAGETAKISEMTRKITLKEITFVDETSKPISAIAVITAIINGEEILATKNLNAEGKILFDSRQVKEIDIRLFEAEDSLEPFYEEIKRSVEGDDEFTIKVISSTAILEPQISFLGVYDSFDKKLERDVITSEEEYYIWFSVKFPEFDAAAFGAFFLMAGREEISSLQPENAGYITWVQAPVKSSVEFGSTFRPTQNNPIADTSESTEDMVRSKKKWIKIILEKPQGEKILKFKIKALENTQKTTAEFFYRGWSQVGNDIFRNPVDEELGTNYDTTEKAGLYAKLEKIELDVFLEKPTCPGEVCITEFIRLSNGQEIPFDNFEAEAGKNYELVYKIKSNTNVTLKRNILFKASSTIGKIQFLVPDNDAGIVVTQQVKRELELLPFEEQEITVVFNPENATLEEIAELRILVSDELEAKLSESKSLRFKVTGNNKLKITMPQTLKLGKNTVLVLNDSSSEDFIEDAKISIYNSENEKIDAIIGTKTSKRGLNGEYLLEVENLFPGIYTLIVEKNEYKTETKTFIISSEKIIEIERISRLDIEQQDESEAKNIVEIEVRNNSEFPITSGGLEIIPDPGLEGLFTLDVLSMPQNLEPGQIGKIILESNYLQGRDETAYSGALIIYSGLVDEKVFADSSTRLTITYNKKLERDCIGLDTPELTIFGLLEENGVGKAEFNVKNVCREVVNFNVNVKAVEEKEGQENISFTFNPETFTLSEGISRFVEVEIKNNADLSGVQGLDYEFVLTLSSSKINIDIPVHITLRSKESILQTNNNIVVPIGRNGKTNILTGVSPLYARNISGKDITDITYFVKQRPDDFLVFVVPFQEIESLLTKFQNKESFFTTLKIESEDVLNGETDDSLIGDISIGDLENSQNNQSTILELDDPLKEFGLSELFLTSEIKKSTTVNPPFAILVFSSNVHSQKNPGVIQVDISGVIDGKRKNLKTVNVWPNIFGASCLTIEGDRTFSFNSPNLAGTTLLEEVTLHNQCLEPVRILDLTPGKIGANSMEIGPAKTIETNSKEKFTFVLTANEAYTNFGLPDKIKIKGILQNSQRFIESTSLNIEAQLGKDNAGLTGPKSNPIDVPICEAGEKDTLSTPQIGEDCSQSYCDAVNLGNYITRKLAVLYNTAKSRLANAGNTIQNFSACSQERSYCSFATLGINSDISKVYLSNDILSNQLLSEKIKSSSNPELTRYAVNYNQLNENSPELTGFSSGQIMMDKQIEGCGTATVKITGAVQNIQGKLNMTNSVFFVTTTENTAKTTQCTNEIQNLPAILPLDIGLIGGTRSGSLATMIESTVELESAARAVAKEIFNDSDRVQQEVNSTRIRLNFGNVEEGGIAKVSLDKGTIVNEGRSTVNLTINRNSGGLTSEELANIGTQAGKALKELIFNPGNVDYCVTKSRSAIILKSFTPSGAIAIEGPTTFKLSSTLTCNPPGDTYKVVSSSNDTVKLSTNLSSGISGVKETRMEDVAGNIIIEDAANLPLVDNPARQGTFYFPFNLCMQGDAGRIGNAHGKIINIKAKSIDSSRESPFYPVELQVCGVHPYSLIDRINEVKPESGESKTNYAIIGWTGSPETVNLKAINNAVDAINKNKKAEQGLNSSEPTHLETVNLENDDQLAIGAYFAACSAVAGFCGAGKFGLGGAAWNVAFDCGLPAGIAVLNTFEGGREFIKSTKEFFAPVVDAVDPFIAPVKDWFKDLWDTQKEYISSALGGIFGGLFGEEQESAQKFNDNILGPAIFGVEFRAIVNGLTADVATTKLNSPDAGVKVPLAAEQMSNKFAENFSAENLDGLSPETRIQIEDELKAPVRDNIENQLRNSMTENPNRTIGEVAEDAARAGVGSSADDVARTIGANFDELKHTELGKRIEGVRTGALSEVFDSERISTAAVDDFVNSGGSLSTSQVDDVARRLAQSAAAGTGLETPPAGMQEFLEGQIKNEIRGSDAFQRAVVSGGSISADESASLLKNSVTKSLASAESKYGQEIIESVGERFVAEAIDPDLKKTLTTNQTIEVADPNARKSKLDGIKQASKNNFNKLKAFGRGLTCGALGNAAGYAASRQVASWLNEGNDTQDGALRLVNGEIGGDEIIKKFQTYKITSSNTDGVINYTIEQVITSDQEVEMLNSIKNTPEIVWEDNCGEFYKNKAASLVGSLIPDPDNVNITSTQTVAYYNNSRFFANAANATGLQEEMIVALMFENPNTILDCSISNTWYNLEEAQRKQKIDCAAANFAEELVKAQGNFDSALAEFTDLFDSEKQNYINRVKSLRDIWGKEKVS